MKYLKGITSLLLVIAPFLPVFSQEKIAVSDTSVHFWVNGLCEMCQDRIQNALKHKGVKQARWDIPTKEVEVVFDPTVVTIEKLHRWVAEAGHDTKLRPAKNITYQALPECCRYRESKEPDFHPESISAITDTTTGTHPAAEKIIVKGIILEVDRKGNFHPLAGASIHWLDMPGFTLSDSNGIFRLPVIENRRKMVVSYTGYQSDTVLVTTSQEMKIVLAAGKQLQVVEVKGRQRASYLSSGVVRTQIMTERELFKAACCNLSESFETNPSVDVAYNDAVTGSKQIQLLGLSGSYTQLTIENLPGPRGLATPLGLNYIPGPWVESIQLTKGIGSVANGFESIAGQINVEMKKPEKSQPLFANIYVNDMGKVDLNLDLSTKISDKWSTTLLLHDNFLNNTQVDGNKDNFRDVPTGNLATFLSRWKYDNMKGFMIQFGVKVLKDGKTGGLTDFDPSTDKYSTNRYGLGIDTRRYEGFLKVGFVFPEKKYKSIGWQFSAFDHKQDSYFGTIQYEARQQNIYSNLIYQSIISSTAHKFRTGISFVSDKYDEQFQLLSFNRKEIVPGAFFEYTYSYLDKFSLVAGMRADHNNLYGWFATPRLHLRYEPVKGSTFRITAGRGQRTANILAENMSVFASARQVQILSAGPGKAYGLDPEVAWNYGISFDQRFSLLQRNGSVAVDYYYTHFNNQVVVDMEDARAVKFYNLGGKSYSSSFQVEINYELIKKLELRIAYRNYNVKTTYGSRLLSKPLVARDRAFANLAYEAGAWKFDYTITLTGTKRIPSTATNPLAYQRKTASPSFVLMNAQVSRTIGAKKMVEVYLGAENLGDYFQKDIIIAANDPFGPYFDASLVWGPVYGRMFYSGIRFHLK